MAGKDQSWGLSHGVQVVESLPVWLFFFSLQVYRSAGVWSRVDHDGSRLALSPLLGAFVGRYRKEDVPFKDDMLEGHVKV